MEQAAAPPDLSGAVGVTISLASLQPWAPEAPSLSLSLSLSSTLFQALNPLRFKALF